MTGTLNRRALTAGVAALSPWPAHAGPFAQRLPKGAPEHGAPLDTSALRVLFQDRFDSFKPYDPVTHASGHWAVVGEGALSGHMRNAATGRALTLAEIDADPRLCLAHRAPRHSGVLALYADESLSPEFRTCFARDNVLHMVARPVPERLREKACGRSFMAPRIWLTTGGRRRGFTYGYFEARLQFDLDAGSHGAFWLYPAAGRWTSEIDVAEYLGQWWRRGPEGDMYHTSTHTNFGQTRGGVRHRGQAINRTWRRYGVLWTADTLTFYLDRRVVRVTPNPGIHEPLYPILQLAVGSRWALQRYRGGGPPDPATFPHRMLVDEVLIARLR